MIKKILMENLDYEKMQKWGSDRLSNVELKLRELEKDKEQIYVIGFDIADENSKDNSVMMQFRVVDGRYIYEGCQTL